MSKKRFRNYDKVILDRDKYFTTDLNEPDALFFIKDASNKEDLTKNVKLNGTRVIRIEATVADYRHIPKVKNSNMKNHFIYTDLDSYQIQYGDHSSYNELLEFVKKLNLDSSKIRPTNAVADENGIITWKMRPHHSNLTFSLKKLDNIVNMASVNESFKDLSLADSKEIEKVKKREFACKKCNEWWFCPSSVLVCF